MLKKKIAVSGAGGQLGLELHDLQQQYPQFDFVFANKDLLPVNNRDIVQQFFATYKPDYFINCAAYTAVDKAETDRDVAFQINAFAVGLLAEQCASLNCRFIHVSTDYVFDGNSPEPYSESDPTSPVNVYGQSKLEGERLSMLANAESIIIRTAWVYSVYGNNFLKTMIRLMNSRPEIRVVSDQIGAPTYAADLAAAIMHIINSELWTAGIYHYSNLGRISWFDFAMAIRKRIGANCNLYAIPSSDYPTPAKRPSFSLLDTSRIRDTFKLQIPNWEESLDRCIARLNT